MEQQQRQQIKKYIDLFLRRNKLILSFVLVGIMAGLGVYLWMPKVYESTALLMYQRAKIDPSSKMAPDIEAQTREMVATLTQQVTSRTSLEAIVKQFELYQDLRQELPMEDVVDLMRERHITVTPDRGDVFTVSFNGSNPKKVQQVANALAARFIEENLRYREEKATETSAYVGDELELSKKTLDKKEEVMRDYKLKYYNEMPQQFAANSGRLTALQTQLQRNRDSVQDLEKTKVLIQEQLTLRKESLMQLAPPLKPGGKLELAGGAAGDRSDLAQARQQLADLKLRYTANHPEVKRLEKKVAALEADQATVTQGIEESSTAGGGARNSAFHDAQLDELTLQLKKADLSISSLNQENDSLKKQIAQYEEWLSKTPVREAEWNALTRDYQQLNDHYQQLVARNLEAGAAESLERRQKGSQFKIVDPAYLPEKPTQPDFLKIMLLTVAAGLGVGCGLAFLLEMRDSSFRDVADIEGYLGLPVICAVPYIHTDGESKSLRRRTILWWTVVASILALLLAGMGYLYETGRIIV